MYYLHVFYNRKRDEFCCGVSDDLRKSTAEQKQISREYQMVFYECFMAKTDAERRLNHLRNIQGQRELRMMLSDSLSMTKPPVDWQNA
ncbi:MAG: hypothetical protein PHO30_04690 [Candidatus Omnitrophica bacterium]|nr:hypothetical protein [Candidatus Omnitrophota bacterium]